MSDEELEKIRKRKEMELRKRASMQQQRKAQEEQIEAQKNAVMRKILEPDARVRLTNIRMVKPNFASQLEVQLIQLAQSNQLQRMGFKLPMSDAQFKQLLKRISAADKKKDINIRRI
ncbi:MAG: DNA-binding protein [Candidatus Lokiarchaeota archaeon]|nr:DNA-binding protein [Candidatus Lokiarchaeota archaeon]